MKHIHARFILPVAVFSVLVACMASSLAAPATVESTSVSTQSVVDANWDELFMGQERHEELSQVAEVVNHQPGTEGYDVVTAEDKAHIMYSDLSKEAALYYAASHKGVVKHVAAKVSQIDGTLCVIRGADMTFNMVMPASEMPELGNFVTIWCVVEE